MLEKSYDGIEYLRYEKNEYTVLTLSDGNDYISLMRSSDDDDEVEQKKDMLSIIGGVPFFNIILYEIDCLRSRKIHGAPVLKLTNAKRRRLNINSILSFHLDENELELLIQV